MISALIERPAQECKILGCQRSVAVERIRMLETENVLLRAAVSKAQAELLEIHTKANAAIIAVNALVPERS